MVTNGRLEGGVDGKEGKMYEDKETGGKDRTG